MTSEVRPLRSYAEVSLGRQRSPKHESGPHMVPYLRAGNVQDGRLSLGDVKEMNFTPEEQHAFALRPGDVLVTEGSGSLRTVGASAVWNGELTGTVCFQNTLLRLRPKPSTDARFLAWWCRYAYASGLFASVSTGANIFHVSAERVRALPMTYLDIAQQRAIADFLDGETGRIDALIDMKTRLLALLEERVDQLITSRIGDSVLAHPEAVGPSAPIRRLLSKERRSVVSAEMITAFRDGQVTARSRRRAEGYTESWSDATALQGVCRGDVVVHGLDGFAGAIGEAESDGMCSPVYHVCTPVDGGDSRYLARLLRILATTGYLELFASSTRERAVDFRNWDLFGRIPIPVVDTSEQHYVGDLISRIGPLRAAIERSTRLAIERRQAIITCAVTGELAVSGAAA